jgi:hypothetical protein
MCPSLRELFGPLDRSYPDIKVHVQHCRHCPAKIESFKLFRVASNGSLEEDIEEWLSLHQNA